MSNAPSVDVSVSAVSTYLNIPHLSRHDGEVVRVGHVGVVCNGMELEAILKHIQFSLPLGHVCDVLITEGVVVAHVEGESVLGDVTVKLTRYPQKCLGVRKSIVRQAVTETVGVLHEFDVIGVDEVMWKPGDMSHVGIVGKTVFRVVG